MAERRITPAWVEPTIGEPDSVEPDPHQPEAERAFRRIPENAGRVLRVVYVRHGDGARVITAFFDRSRRR
ncbi:MAG: DUF4258 domain-containing protein [Bauldia sp.]|nr:MAG: DUF4258 domain-containing protein [Bauldia sp.]MBZ0228345.1 DUF4258 domain-containing protein [Bauldia sp.]